MSLVKMILGWPAIVLLAVLVISAEVLGSQSISKLLWWLAALVAVIAAINTTSYR